MLNPSWKLDQRWNLPKRLNQMLLLIANVPGSYQEAGRTIEIFRILPVHWELPLMLLIALAFGFVFTVISIVNEWLPALE